MAGMRSRARAARLGWFVLLWAAGVAALGACAVVVKAVMWLAGFR
jgi:hypothetical protein